MSGSSDKSGNAKAMKSLKEKREISVQSTGENGENDIGVSSTITGWWLQRFSLHIVGEWGIELLFQICWLQVQTQ